MIITMIAFDFYIDLRKPFTNIIIRILKLLINISFNNIIIIINTIIFIDFHLKYIMLNEVIIYKKFEIVDFLTDLFNEYQDLFID